MSDSQDEQLDIQAVVEALLNICGQVAEMQIDEASRTAIYDMCDAVAEHHDIPRVDALIEDHVDGSSTVTSYYGDGIQEAIEGAMLEHTKFKPELKLVVNNLDEDIDDDETIH